MRLQTPSNKAEGSIRKAQNGSKNRLEEEEKDDVKENSFLVL
jgi:hypothetical protein